MHNYFNDKMFNPNYVTLEFYNISVKPKENSFAQNKKVTDAIKTKHNLYEAVKGMDSSHQEIAFLACFTEMAREMNRSLREVNL